MHPVISKLKYPRDKRPQIWRQGVLQIWVTRACDKACFGCTQGSNLGGKPGMMTPNQFADACDSLKDYWGVVGMFGGNPAIHPQFDELCAIMRDKIPYTQRGLWCNNLMGKGEHARITFNPEVSNLNVHMDAEAHAEFLRDWPEAANIVKGLTGDSRHSPPYVSMRDVVPDEEERWRLISTCDVNRLWSAIICIFRGELRGYFCEIAGAQAMLRQGDPEYPDLGIPVSANKGWWKEGPESFADQVTFHCHRCGIPLRGHGALATTGPTEHTSAEYAGVYRPKIKGREVQVVTSIDQLGDPLRRATDYIENGSIK